MFRVGRYQDVPADIHTRSGAFFEGDYRQPIQEVIENLLPLCGGLFGDPILNLRGWRKNAAVVADLSKATQATDSRSRTEGQQVAVVNFGGKSRCAKRIETQIFVEVQRETIRADSAMEVDRATILPPEYRS